MSSPSQKYGTYWFLQLLLRRLLLRFFSILTWRLGNGFCSLLVLLLGRQRQFLDSSLEALLDAVRQRQSAGRAEPDPEAEAVLETLQETAGIRALQYDRPDIT